jgi:hypothetical protein
LQGGEEAAVNNQLITLTPLMLGFGVFVLLIALVIVVRSIQTRRAEERTFGLQNAAKLRGWPFVQAVGMDWIPNLDRFALFNQGHTKSITNVMYGEIDGVKTALFDYEYVTGSGKNRSAYNQSVAYFEPPGLSLPLFSLRPENAIYKIMSAFGYQDIDFGNRPEFSKLYLLRGPDEQAIRNTFNEAAFGFYEMNQGTCTDGGGNQLFVFRQSHRAAPLETQAFINWAVGVKNLFAARW